MLLDLPIGVMDVCAGLVVAIISWGGMELIDMKQTTLLLAAEQVHIKDSLEPLKGIPVVLERIEVTLENLKEDVKNGGG